MTAEIVENCGNVLKNSEKSKNEPGFGNYHTEKPSQFNISGGIDNNSHKYNIVAIGFGIFLRRKPNGDVAIIINKPELNFESEILVKQDDWEHAIKQMEMIPAL